MIDQSNGSPYDRGAADSYYRRPYDPHYWPEGTGHGVRIELAEMTVVQIVEYTKGFQDNEASMNFKEY